MRRSREIGGRAIGRMAPGGRFAAGLLAVAIAGCGSTKVVTHTVRHTDTTTNTVTNTITKKVRPTRTVTGPTRTVTVTKTITKTTASGSGGGGGGGTPVEGPGSYSHAADALFCSTHSCIDNFPNGTGYVVQCVDGEWSHSGGKSGACSDHGGVG